MHIERFGNPVEVAAGSVEPSKMQAKTPGMFSLNSLAYWLNASTSHLAAVPEIASQNVFFLFQGFDEKNAMPFWGLHQFLFGFGRRYDTQNSTDFSEFLFKQSLRFAMPFVSCILRN